MLGFGHYYAWTNAGLCECKYCMIPKSMTKNSSSWKAMKSKKKKKKRKEKSFCCGGMENKSNGKATRKIKNNVIWLKACLTSKEYKKKLPHWHYCFSFIEDQALFLWFLEATFCFRKQSLHTNRLELNSYESISMERLRTIYRVDNLGVHACLINKQTSISTLRTQILTKCVFSLKVKSMLWICSEI